MEPWRFPLPCRSRKSKRGTSVLGEWRIHKLSFEEGLELFSVIGWMVNILCFNGPLRHRPKHAEVVWLTAHGPITHAQGMLCIQMVVLVPIGSPALWDAASVHSGRQRSWLSYSSRKIVVCQMVSLAPFDPILHYTDILCLFFICMLPESQLTNARASTYMCVCVLVGPCTVRIYRVSVTIPHSRVSRRISLKGTF